MLSVWFLADTLFKDLLVLGISAVFIFAFLAAYYFGAIRRGLWGEPVPRSLLIGYFGGFIAVGISIGAAMVWHWVTGH